MTKGEIYLFAVQANRTWGIPTEIALPIYKCKYYIRQFIDNNPEVVYVISGLMFSYFLYSSIRDLIKKRKLKKEGP